MRSFLPRPALRHASLLALALATPAALAQGPDPSKAEVPLPCAAEDWRAFLVIDNGATGIWTVESFPVFEQYACPEIVGLDDLGRCHVLVSYSGKWTPLTRCGDGKWLGGLCHGDVDPRVAGAELYTGGQNGNVYQLVSYPHGALDCRLIAHLPGLEVHTMLAGELDPQSPGPEILVFTRPGHLYRTSPTGPDGTFETVHLEKLPGRVRDARLLPAQPGRPREIATVSRAGVLALLTIDADGTHWRVVHEAPMGKGRIALRPAAAEEPTVLYSTLDDGRVLRHERAGEGEWRTETIYAGPQGPRGVAAGRFDADPSAETVAVFGYSRKVQLLTRRGSAWTVETLFVDRDKGHWLAAAELDGRNGTDELIGSGYGGRIFLLARPPGYGDPGVLVEPPEREERESRANAPRTVRLATRAGASAAGELSTLRYSGGFETKTLVYETLVQRGPDGRIAPALAASWRHADGGRTLVLELRAGARFHDGTPVTAAAVAQHFRRWVGLPEHAWLRGSRHIERVAARSERELEIRLDEPYALLPDLCAINPCGVRAPASVDREGEFVRPVGSGPFRYEGASEDGRVLHYRRFVPEGGSEGGALDVVCLDRDPAAEAAALLRAGEVDVVVGGWQVPLSGADVAPLRADPRYRVLEAPGSSVVYLSFRLDGGPTADAAVRRAVRERVDRAALVRRVAPEAADPCDAWAAPTVAVWPRSSVPARASANGPPASSGTLVLVAAAGTWEEAPARALAADLEDAGLPVALELLEPRAAAEALERRAFDLRLERTWGVPYDPYLSLVARFAPPLDAPSAALDRAHGVPAELTRLVEAAMREPEETRRSKVYARIQERMDEEAWIVPLYVPRRFAVARAGLGEIPLDHDLYRADLSGVALRR